MQTCLRLFKFSLVQERLDDAVLGRDVSAASPRDVALAWVQGNTVSLEKGLRGNNWKEVEDIEDDAVLMIRQRYPEWSWLPHQKHQVQKTQAGAQI